MRRKKIGKPRDFKMPRSRVVTAMAKKEADKWFQLYTCGSLEAKTARRLANWLIRVADWMEIK